MKNISLLLALAITLFCGRAQATVVSPQTASTIAVNFFKVNAPAYGGTTLTATLVYTQTETDNTADYYVFDINPGHGFVIVSADDNLTPVIGYSTETNFNLNFSKYPISSWMQSAAKKIHYSLQQHVPANARITNLWNAYTQGINPVVGRSGSVGPLLQTTWDQEPNYNQLCPYNSTDQQRAVTGCVATAMAQVMRYWSYPPAGRGSFSYDDAPPAYSNNYGVQSANFTTPLNWTNMPPSITNTSNSVDTLMYECGVSVAMDYGDDNEGGSGAWVLQSEAGAGQPCAQYSYVQYFLYDSNTIQGVTMANFSASAWMTLMLNELNANRVIQYAGDDVNGAGGHTWVCDGYDANNMLHMNWGWSGQSDGYFAVTNLDAGSYNFDDGEEALIGIQPPPPFSIRAIAASSALCPGNSTTLTAQGPAGATYSWTPTTGLSCPTCAVTTVNPDSANMIYTVTADSAGVTGAATVAVNITPKVLAGFSVQQTPTCSVPAAITFANASANATNYLWSFGDGTTDTAVNPVHTYNAYGSFNVQLIAANACGIDSVLQNQVVTVHDFTPAVTGQSVCSGESATLSATGTGQISWYNAEAGGTLVDTGTTFTTPALSTSTTYYVSSTLQPAVNSVGPADNTFGSGSYFAGANKHSVIFNCTTPQTLLTVDVYTQTAGYRMVQLQDSNGNVLQSDSINMAAGQSTITLNFPIPAANELYLAIVGTDGLYRNNSGAAYPYTSTDSTIVITGSDAGVPGYYYFFYNWKLQQQACVTAPVAVVASVIAQGSGWFNATGTGSTTVNFSSPAVGITYAWNFGDGSTANTQNPTHTYASSGTYTVVLVETKGNCTDTITQSITTTTLGIAEVNGLTGLSLFPNPAKEQLTVGIHTDKQLNGYTLSVRNILGQSVSSQSIDLSNGENSVTLNVSWLAQGIYFVNVQNGTESVTRKFVKAE